MTATLPTVSTRLEIAPPEAPPRTCSRCRQPIASRLSARYQVEYPGAAARLVLRLCRRCFALSLLLDADLEGGGDVPDFRELELLTGLLDRGAE